MLPALRRLFVLLLPLLAWAPPAQPAVADPELQQSERETFIRILRAVERKQSLAKQDIPDSLRDYPLYPYLELEDLSNRYTQLPFEEIDSFLERHEDSWAARRLRSQWLAALARKQRWQDYLKYYDDAVAGRSHQCWYLEALHQSGETELALVETSELWMTATSMPHSCDDAFRRWLGSGMQTEPLIWQRLLLALEHGNYRLSRYLTTRLDGEYKAQARRLLSLYRNPKQLPQVVAAVSAAPHAGQVLSITLERLARYDTEAATRLWSRYRQRGLLDDAGSFRVRQAIARQVIAADEDALAWLLRNDPNAEDSYLLEWRVRLAMRSADWRNVEQWIALLPAEESVSPRWRYWLARALSEQDDKVEAGTSLLADVAGERNFYGFLAADRLGRAYDLNHRPGHTAALERLGELPAIRRAAEWLALEDVPAARREWGHALSGLNREGQRAAARLAREWGWHSQAIRAAIRARDWDDLELRFPLAHRDSMLGFASQRAIPPAWLYAVARQESAFAHDARSGAGALGLLQLMPATAKQVARSIGRGYSRHALLQPEHNIELGSTYLSQLLERFDGNRVLATAAYNAGPERISRVLSRQSAALPHDVWIENLPYHETREYVQSVLAFQVIYGYRLGDSQPLVSARETLIAPPVPES